MNKQEAFENAIQAGSIAVQFLKGLYSDPAVALRVRETSQAQYKKLDAALTEAKELFYSGTEVTVETPNQTLEPTTEQENEDDK